MKCKPQKLVAEQTLNSFVMLINVQNFVYNHSLPAVDNGVSNLTLNTLSQVPDFDSIGWLWFYAMSQHKLDTMFVKVTYKAEFRS